MLRLRRGLGPVVVLEHEDGGDLPELRHVQRLVERADVRRAVAEESESDTRLAAHLECKRCAGDLRQPAADHRVRTEVAALDVVEVHRAAVSVRAPFLLAVQLGHQLVGMRALRERVPMGAVGRRDHIAVLERAAHADGARLLADRDMEEAGKLARAEALLHLLLETADEQHLAQDVGKVSLRERRLCLDLCHGAQFMVQPMALVDQWDTIQRGLDPRWNDAHVVLTLADAALAGRAAALLAPAGPVKTDAALRFYVARNGPGVGPEAVQRMLRRLDGESIEGSLELLAATEAAGRGAGRTALPRRVVGRSTRRPAGRLERPPLRAGALLERSSRRHGAAPRPGESAARE